MDRFSIQKLIRERLFAEQGTIRREAQNRAVLAYPSPYHVGMSSLGFQTMYRGLNEVPGWSCERAFLPDDVAAYQRAQLPLITYESESLVGGAAVIAFSVAYELEIGGLIDCLELCGLPVLARDRSAAQPLIVGGGPLTFSNPLPIGPFVDVVILGEAETLGPALLRAVEGEPNRDALLRQLATISGFWIPSIHGATLGSIAKVEDQDLPAYSQVLTPNTELSSMFLIEPERGCSRGCTYCVMRRSTNGGMRLV